MKKTFAFLALVATIVLASCGPSKKIMKLDNTGDVQSVLLKVGQVYQMELTENPSTGYFWNAVLPEGCVVSEQSSEFKPKKSSKDIVGAPGTRIFQFKGESEGVCRVLLAKVRGGDNNPTDKKEIIIKVVK